jgi:hypothetical protein
MCYKKEVTKEKMGKKGSQEEMQKTNKDKTGVSTPFVSNLSYVHPQLSNKNM